MSENVSFKPIKSNETTPLELDQLSGSTHGTRFKKEGTPFLSLFRYATCGDKLLMLVGSLFAAITGAGWPVMSILFGSLTDTFITGAGSSDVTVTSGSSDVTVIIGNVSDVQYNISNDSSNDSSQSTFDQQMTKYAIFYMYLAAGVLVSGYVQVMCWTSACEKQVNSIRTAFFQSIIKQEIGWFDKHQTGSLTSRLVDDLEKIRNGLGDKVSLFIQNLFRFVIGLSIGFWESWKLTLVMLSLCPFMAIATGLHFWVAANFTKREQDCYASAGSVASEVLSCIKTVMSFNGQQHEKVRYEKALEAGKNIGTRKAVLSGFFDGLFWLFLFSMYALAFWYGSEQVELYFNSNMVDGIRPGTVITVFFCVQIGSYSLGISVSFVRQIMAAKGASEFLFGVIDNKPEIDASSKDGLHPTEMRGDICFTSINFSYPTRPDVTIFNNFELKIKEGQTVALVGSSGCGKSTVINLVQRFYDPTEGEITVDGHPLNELNLRWLRQNIGVVSQDPVLFGFTIAENIRLGKPNATLEEIKTAAKEANAHDFIVKLTSGYETIVGERGSQLSGGQKQRVAIARALIRNPRILLLDEATSALDSESERVVQEALDKALRGRTTIIVAHRLTTVQNADVIYVMDQGKIVEDGTHSELMEKKSYYYDLVQAQTIASQEEDSLDEDEEEDEDDDLAELPERDAEYKSLVKRQLSRQKSHMSYRDDKIPLHEVYDDSDEETQPVKYRRILVENAPEKFYIIVGCAASIIQGITMPMFAIVFSEIIKVFIDSGEDNLLWSMMFLVLGGISFLCHFFMNSCFGQSGERLVMRLRLKMFSAYLRQEVSYYDNHSTGAITTRLATDATLVKNATGSQVGTVLGAFFSFVAALVVAFVFGWALALLVLCSIPVIMASSFIKSKITVGNRRQDEGDLENAGKTASDAIENIRTVQSLTREMYFLDKYCGYLTGPLKTSLKQAQLYGLTFGLAQGLFFAVYGGAFRFGAWRVSIGDMQPENVYRVFFALAFTAMSVGQATSFLPDYNRAKQAAGSIFRTLDMVPFIDIYSEKGQTLDKVQGRIEFKEVRFSYPMRPKIKVLNGISFNVEPGQTVALVGPSGCGKSTVISLIQRFYDPKAGKILIDGHNICELNLRKLRSTVTVVSQEPTLFDCSIRDNIVYGLRDEIETDRVIQAAREANIHEFIVSLPSGYDTIVGEKGTQLSGGQKQRVAIARALIRNPKILLLDEATSALDSESEKLVQAALDKAQEGRTCIVIAHRLSTIQNADRICVMDNGRILESGTHQELLGNKAAYAALVNAQHFVS